MMRRWASPLALFLAVAQAGCPVCPAESNAALDAPRKAVQMADFRASGHLVRVDPGGARISYPIEIKAHWFPGVLRVLVEVAGPPNPTSSQPSQNRAAPVHVLLELRPNGQSTIRVAHRGDSAPVALPVEKWTDGLAGTGFSYEDLFEEQYFWAGQSVTPDTKYGARVCDLLKSTPGLTDRTHYAEVSTWLDHGIGFPVYAEKTVKSSGELKQYTYFGLRKEGGMWSASQVEEKNRGQAGSTLLIIDRGSPKANLSLADFSQEQLLHFH
jgi:hypothetical protein